MRLLLDTHTFLWFIGGDAALSPYACQLIEDRTNERLLSIASLWEMAIKVSLGRLTVPLPFTDLVAEHVYGNAVCFRQACVTGEFARAYSHNHVNIMTGRQRCTT